MSQIRHGDWFAALRRASFDILAAMARVLAASIVLSVVTISGQTPPRQTQEDDYTKYELLTPESAQFRIYYEVTATTAGARFFYNTIRPGSIATDERVIDLATGQPL
jgi:hypothetical protein